MNPAKLPLANSAIALLLLLAANFAHAQKEKSDANYYRPQPGREVPWSAHVDASPMSLDGPPSSWGAISLGAQQRKAIFPILSSPFAALSPRQSKGKKKEEGLLQVYDLRSGRPVGKQFKIKIALGEHAALAQDGSYLAARLPGKQNPHTIDVIATATGESIRHIEAGRDKEWSLPIAFVGTDLLLTQTHESQVPDWTEKTEYKVWNVRTGELLSELAFDLVWSPTSVGLSNGGKYIVFRLLKGSIGQRLVIMDLGTGKVAGDIEYRGKNEPFAGSAGIVFSPDGKEIAMLWQFLGKKKDQFGKVLVFDATNGRLLASHDLRDMAGIDTSSHGGLESIQWVPDGSGWLLFGSLLLDRQTGKELARLARDKKLPSPRRFVGPEQVTIFIGGLDPKLTLAPVRTAGR